MNETGHRTDLAVRSLILPLFFRRTAGSGSSKIRSAGYDPKSQVLEIEFSDGKIVQYRGVSPEVHRQFMAAPSPTSFFEDKIDESFPSTRLK